MLLNVAVIFSRSKNATGVKRRRDLQHSDSKHKGTRNINHGAATECMFSFGDAPATLMLSPLLYT
jgi:hypothetical protein